MSKMRMNGLLCMLMFMALCFCGAEANAQLTYTWDGGGSTQDWTDPLNWDKDSNYPGYGTGDVAVFDGTSTKQADIPLTKAITIGTLTVSSSAGLTQRIRLLNNLNVGTLNVGHTSAANTLELVAGGAVVNVSSAVALLSGAVVKSATVAEITVNLLSSVGNSVTMQGVATAAGTRFGDYIKTVLNDDLTLSTDLRFDGDLDLNGYTVVLGYNDLFMGVNADILNHTAGVDATSN